MPSTGFAQQAQIQSLYRNHQGWLLGWLGKKLGCTERAADLMHDTFVRLLVQDEVQTLQQPRAYLMTIARRVLVDHWRRERVEKAYLEAITRIPRQHAPGPEEKHLILETLLDIDRRLAGLPVVVKRTFLHAQLGGLKQREIAEKTGVSLSTVKRHLIRAYTQCYFALDAE